MKRLDKMTDALLLLGSNIEPLANINSALQALDKMPDSHVIAVSATYVTPAIGANGEQADQPDFHNTAVHLQTVLDIHDLRLRLREIEALHGRLRTQDKFAARPLDIDITFFGQSILTIDGTDIPDPDVEQQAYVVIPLAEIAPNWRHPQTGQSLRQIADRLANQEMEFVQI